MNTFEAFHNGKLITPAATKNFRNIPWSKHPTFAGVELKHILTSEETGGAYSYHLVRIAPNCSIGEHIHETQLETHEVIAGNGTCINEGTSIPYEPGILSTTIYLWLISLTASKELSILLLKLYNDGAIGISYSFLGLRVRKLD